MWQQHWRDASLGPSSRCPRPRHSVPAVKQTRAGENFNFAHRPRAVHLPWKRRVCNLFGGVLRNGDIGLIEHPLKINSAAMIDSCSSVCRTARLTSCLFGRVCSSRIGATSWEFFTQSDTYPECNVRENEGKRREGACMYVAGEEPPCPPVFSLNFLFFFFLFFYSNSTIRSLQ